MNKDPKPIIASPANLNHNGCRCKETFNALARLVRAAVMYEVCFVAMRIPKILQMPEEMPPHTNDMAIQA